MSKRTTIRIDPIMCDGHGLCAELLPEHIRLDDWGYPIACDGHGLCAELFPERVALDDWGYPIVDAEPVRPDLVKLARRAEAACPTLALLLESRRDPAR